MNKTTTKIRLLILLLFIMVAPKWIFAQFEDPVTVSSSAIQEARAGEVVDVVVTVDLDQGWYIYAIEGITEGPVPTKITVTGNSIDKVGVVQEPEPTVKFDEGFQIVVPYHLGSPQFIIPVKLKDDLNTGSIQLDVKILYQVCNNVLCYPPTENITSVVIDL